MISYSVTISIDPAAESEWLEWMTAVHIPDVLRTGCFLECRSYKLLESDGENPAYVLQYHCRSIEQYERYRRNFAPDLQKDHSSRFAGRFHASRQLLEEIAYSQFGPEG
jgi:hypothetical protein